MGQRGRSTGKDGVIGAYNIHGMDRLLLSFFNQTLAHPLLDYLMVGLTTVGFIALPGLGILLLFSRGHRRVGMSVLWAVGCGLTLALLFQYLALRPRPEAVRLLLPAPNFPSFPSGHATTAFAVAIVVGLAYKKMRWWSGALLLATLIALSRLYLGHHYPSDLFGGAVLGGAVGAACYGLVGVSRPRWPWLLWPQIAIAVVVTQMAYLDILPGHLLQWPLADKVTHFLLFGAVVFWLNLWLKGRRLTWAGWAVPLAILLSFGLAAAEETLQFFSPLRNADLFDLASDLAGMVFFWWLSERLLKRESQP